jgi:hypothetical protein
MTNQEIIELFDSNPNMLMSEMTAITGKSMSELKKILLN